MRRLVEARPFLRHLIRRELRLRYAGSALGWLWALLKPLSSLAVYAVVFGEFLRTQPPVGPDGFESFVHFLFAGLVVWNLFSAVSTGAMEAFTESMALRRQVYFPPESPGVARSAVLSAEAAVEVVVLVAAFLAVGRLSLPMLLLPVVLALTLLAGLGVGFALSVVNVEYRDVAHLWGVALRFLFFLTPVIYPMSLLESSDALVARVGAAIVRANPVTSLVGLSRDLTYFSSWPGIGSLAAAVAWTVAIFGLGWWYFARRADLLCEGR